MHNDNEGPREGQENSTPFPEKPEESSPKPVPLTALVGTGDPFLDELNRLSATVDADVLRFRAREEHAKGLACLHEATRHMRMQSELIARAEEIEAMVGKAEKDAEPSSSRAPIPPNDNRLSNENAESNAGDPAFALRSDGKVLMNIAHVQGRKVHSMRTWTGVVLNSVTILADRQKKAAFHQRRSLVNTPQTGCGL